MRQKDRATLGQAPLLHRRQQDAFKGRLWFRERRRCALSGAGWEDTSVAGEAPPPNELARTKPHLATTTRTIWPSPSGGETRQP